MITSGKGYVDMLDFEEEKTIKKYKQEEKNDILSVMAYVSIIDLICSVYNSLVETSIRNISKIIKKKVDIFGLDIKEANKKFKEIIAFKDDLIKRFKNREDVNIEFIEETILVMEKSLEEYHLVKIGEKVLSSHFNKISINEYIRLFEKHIVGYDTNIDGEVNTTKNTIKFLIDNILFSKLDLEKSYTDLGEVKEENLNKENKIKELQKEIDDLKKQIKSTNREKGRMGELVTEKESTIKRLEARIALLERELRSVKKELEETNNSFIENTRENNTDLGDVEAAEILLTELEQKNRVLKEENEGLNNELLAEKIKNNSLEQTLNGFSQTQNFLYSCELKKEKCSLGDMLKYLTIKDFPSIYKQKLVGIILDFLDDLLMNSSKTASSARNGNPGAGSGTYANLFLNPLINFIKEKGKNQLSSQMFLEYIGSINWKNIYNELPEANYSDKKGVIHERVFDKLEKGTYKNIFEALYELSSSLMEIKKGGVHLVALSNNIKSFIDGRKDVLERRFREVFLEILNNK
ncbi:MAG: hypothetical protein PHN31_02030 [Candidatus Gracilibacteria bacterium]|nr:hypothetical protein [Candidatus Gracilibacteria bacterium]